ncbi:CAP family protein [Embleya hyalina]|uniref:Serine protease n=1 Tax=Embleya hyalina TaxID=516124 RepID=A0A401Z046_9ACTN|nr:CAP family protein [Embleya hyalina]GCE00227.1 serine protease [Embleya hyalina]
MRKRFGVPAAAAAVLVVAAAVPATARRALPDATDNAFLNEMLAAINAYRSRHGVPAVRLDPGLNAYARQRAAQVSSDDGLDERHAGLRVGTGETLFWAGSSASSPVSATEAAKAWYDEIAEYDFGRGEFGPDTGNFTQLVWKGSTRIGAARSAGRGSRWYETCIVVNWQAPGNMMGVFRDNVFPAR